MSGRRREHQRARRRWVWGAAPPAGLMASTRTLATRPVLRGPASSLRRNPAAGWRHLDVVLLASTAALATVGLLVVYSATRSGTDPTKTGLVGDTTYLKRQ